MKKLNWIFYGDNTRQSSLVNTMKAVESIHAKMDELMALIPKLTEQITEDLGMKLQEMKHELLTLNAETWSITIRACETGEKWG